VTTNEVRQETDKNNDNKSQGLDGFHQNVLKQLKEEIVELVKEMCNLRLSPL